MLNLMAMFTFFCVRPKVPESTISVLNYNYLFYINLVPSLIWVCWWCQWLYTPFLFQAGSTLSEQIWSKKSRLFVLEMKLGIYSNLIMLNSIVIFTFLYQIGGTRFGQVWSKNSKSLVNLNGGIQFIFF